MNILLLRRQHVVFIAKTHRIMMCHLKYSILSEASVGICIQKKRLPGEGRR